ncbi:MAG: exo-alpha-sialidase [Clostridiaceae bacterium]|nr:exo-alpha-sialidase [Clostridiaceae bacterium]
MPRGLPFFIDGESNKRFKNEQEGFMRSLSVPPDEIPTCSTVFSAIGLRTQDFRGLIPDETGKIPGKQPAHMDRDYVEWETSPAESTETTVFTWIGGFQVWPVRPAFPYIAATLVIDDTQRIQFPINIIERFAIELDGFALWFEPKRFQSLAETYTHRFLAPGGVCGFFRLQVPGDRLTLGKPVKLRVELPKTSGEYEALFFVSPRKDALKVDLSILRQEINTLQDDLMRLTMSLQMLYTKNYPELFPRLVKGDVKIVYQDETKHLHPATITVLSGDEIVITCREATDHYAKDGHIIMIRSKDGGNTWSEKEVIIDCGNSDHRCAPIFELENGDLLAIDYRAGGLYAGDGRFSPGDMQEPTLWGAWSTDRGKTWNFSKNPLTVPGHKTKYAEAERHMIRLPSGRLLVAANISAGKIPNDIGVTIAVFYSDDNGRNWEFVTLLPRNNFLVGEPSMIRTKSGKIVMVTRSHTFGRIDDADWANNGMGGLLQSVSYDEGKTWSEFRPTNISSMNSPGHLLQLKDGRILCSHASRTYPGAICVTLSYDECETWDTKNTRIITNDLANWDSCYPTSGQLSDGSIITTWYANLFGKYFIAIKKYRPEDL